MRKITLYFLLLVSGLFNYISLSMDKKSYFQQAVHTIGKNYLNPVQYITDITSAELCEEILKYNTTLAEHKKFVIDNESLDKIHRVFEREQKLLKVVEDAITAKSPSHSEVEQLLNNAPKGYYSPNALAIINGYLNTKIIRAEADAQKLKIYLGPALENAESLTNASKNSGPPAEVKLPSLDKKQLTVSPSTLEEVILDSNPTILGKTFNFISKEWDPISYLTSSKSEDISKYIPRFNPNSSQHVAFNPNLKFHCTLIHNAFEREHRLLNTIETALKSNNSETIIKLNNKVSKGYFSDTLHAIISGYLEFIATQKVSDSEMRREQVILSQKKLENSKIKNESNSEMQPTFISATQPISISSNSSAVSSPSSTPTNQKSLTPSTASSTEFEKELKDALIQEKKAFAQLKSANKLMKTSNDSPKSQSSGNPFHQSFDALIEDLGKKLIISEPNKSESQNLINDAVLEFDKHEQQPSNDTTNNNSSY